MTQWVRQYNYLDIRDGRFKSTTPVDETLRAIDQTGVTECDKSLGNGSAKVLKSKEKKNEIRLDIAEGYSVVVAGSFETLFL